MLLGYNTNGLAHHDPVQAIELLSEIGYSSVAITIDHGVLNPYADGWQEQVARFRELLVRHSMRSVVETGARFLLDARVKHEPTLMSGNAECRARRVEFLCRAIDIAAGLGSDCVSLWSGILRDEISEEQAMDRLVEGLRDVIDYSSAKGVTIGFEPEPGMFIDTMVKYEQLAQRIDSSVFQLTLDVGHLHCLGEVPIDDQFRRWGERIVNIHIEDMRRGVHEHLMFGEGEMDFPPIIDALKEIGYKGGINVELSRHSHEGPAAAQRAFEFLNALASSDSK